MLRLTLERNIDIMRIPPGDITDPKLAVTVINAQRQIGASIITAVVRVDDAKLRRAPDDKYDKLLAELKGGEAPDEEIDLFGDC